MKTKTVADKIVIVRLKGKNFIINNKKAKTIEILMRHNKRVLRGNA